MRRTPAATETFIDGQMRALTRWNSLGVAHHHGHGELSSDVVATDLLGPAARRASALIYRATRHPSVQATQLVTRTIRERGASLIHGHYVIDARFWLRAIRRSRLPLIVSAYGWDVSSFPRSMHGLGGLYLAGIRESVDLFLAMSDAMKQDLIDLGFSASRVEVHYHGVPTGRFRAAGRDRSAPVDGWPTILSVASLVPKKGHQDLIEAVRVLRDLGIDCRLRVVGNGPLAPELARQVAVSNLVDRVEFLPHIPHRDDRLTEVYRTADIFALPSRTAPDGDKDGIPGVIVEAMAAGLPVVSTFHAGIPTVVRDGATGFLAPEGDSQALARNLMTLLEAPQRADVMGRAGAELARERFDMTAAARRLEAIYDRVVDGSRS